MYDALRWMVVVIHGVYLLQGNSEEGTIILLTFAIQRGYMHRCFTIVSYRVEFQGVSNNFTHSTNSYMHQTICISVLNLRRTQSKASHLWRSLIYNGKTPRS